MDALQTYGDKHRETYLLEGAWDGEITKGDAAIQAGKQTIADLESQEPVASSLVECVMSARKEFSAIKGESQFCTECHAFERADSWWQEWHGGDIDYIIGAKYNHPPQRTWVGLTDEEVMSLLPGAVRLPPGWIDTVRAIEAKLKEKNNV